MPFSVRGTRERLRRLGVLNVIGRDVARLFFPLLDDGRIAHDLDLALVIGETHAPTETRFVKITQLRLVSVVIRRAEQSPAQPAPGDIREVALHRLRLRGLARSEERR